MTDIKNILNKDYLDKQDIIALLSLNKEDCSLLFEKSTEIKHQYIGKKVFFRGLIELSNVCKKDCLYCGIRRGNKNTSRYELDDDQVLAAAKYAHENNFGSVVIQAGERTDNIFTKRITNLIKEIKKLSDNKLGITLSLGEQTEEIYKEWFDAGAHRYLLRIEESDQTLYKKLHPNNELHSFDVRLQALKTIQKVGYQTGTGVMIGLPFQTIENLADDLIFFRDMDIDMVGMAQCNLQRF